MKKQFAKIFFSIAIMFLAFLAFTGKVNAEGTRDMYDWEHYSNADRENDRWFYYYDEDNTALGLKTDTVVKVYANKGEKIKLATSGTGFRVTKPGETTTTTIAVTQTNGAQGFIYSANQEKNKTYNYITMTADKTGVYSFKLLQSRTQSTANVNGRLSMHNINSGDTPFTSFQTVAYIAAWDIQIEDAEGNDINGRVWQDYVNIYRGYTSYNNYSNGNVDYYILTDDGYTYDMKCLGMDPGGMNFFIGTRGLISKSTNEILYKSVSDSEIGSSVLMPVPSNGSTEYDSYGKIFYNKPSADLPLSIKKEPKPTTILEDLTFNETENRGEAKLAGTFSFSISDACMYTIKITDKNTGALVRTLNSAGVSGKNTIIWDGKNNSGSYVSAGEYSATLELRNGEYHFILNDVETINSGITIKSEENGDATIYYNNLSIGGYNISSTGINSETTPFKYNTNFGDHKLINLWTYNSVQSSTDFFVMDEYQGTKCVLKGKVFFDANNDKTFNQQDSPLSGIKIKITNTTTGDVIYTTTVTNGEFFANVLKNATYKIEVDSESKNTRLLNYTNTTKNETQTKTVTSDINVGDIGYYVQTKDIIVQKIWDDVNNEAGLRPSTISVKVFDDNTEVGVYQIKASNGWVGTISLPKLRNGSEIIYTLEEEEVSSAYKKENTSIVRDGNTYTITNVMEPPENLVLLNINKVWEDNDNELNIRPNSISGTINSSTNQVIPYTINKNENWHKNLLVDKYDTNNNLIEYTVTEDDVTGYTTNIENTGSNYTITNTITERVNIEVSKQWEDHTTEARPDSVTVHLMNGDEIVETKTLTSDSNWSATFNMAEKYDENGDVIDYDVVEDEVLGYELKSITKNGSNFTIVNKKIEIFSMTITKEWNDKDNINNVRPQNIVVDIMNNNTNEIAKSNISISEASDWTIIVDGLKRYDDFDNEIEYFIKEHEVDNYSITKNEITNLQDGNKNCELENSINITKLMIQKEWDDNDNSAGKRPETLDVTIMNGNEKVEVITLKESEEWKTIAGPYNKYDLDGNEIEYTVVEDDIRMYVLQDTTKEEASAYKELSFIPNNWIKKEDGTWASNTIGTSNSTATLQSEQFTITQTVNLEFDWSVSSESYKYDYIIFTITNGSSTVSVSNNRMGGTNHGTVYESLTFDHVSITLNPGTYAIKFDYIKDGSVNTGLDQGFVKHVGYNDPSAVGADYVYTLNNKFIVPDEKLNYIIEKSWDDNNNARGRRPSEITIGVFGNGNLINEYELTASDNWIKYVSDLPKYDQNGDEIEYSFEETNTNSLFYSLENATINENEDGKIAILNRYDRPTEKINVKLKKTWDDNNNSAGKRPDSITCNLYQNGELINSYEINSSENWEKNVENLYKYDEDGVEINYTIDENNVSMYKLSSEFTKENDIKFEPIEFNIEGSTNWQRRDDGTYNSVTQNSHNSTAILKSEKFTMNESGNIEFDWSVSSESNCDFLWYELKNEAGSIIKGGKEATKISGTNYGTPYSNLSFTHINLDLNPGTYTIEFSYGKDGSVNTGLDQGFIKNLKVSKTLESSYIYTLNNKYEQATETTDLTIVKQWDDNNNENNKRPTEITVGLYEDGTKRNTYTLKASENWTKTITGLAKKYTNGTNINYSVLEENTNSVFYKTSNAVISEIENNTVTVTNTYRFPDDKKELTIEKIWDDNNNSAGKRPEQIEIGLYENDVLKDTYTITEDENWIKQITELPVYDSDGEKITYSVLETNTNSLFYNKDDAIISDLEDGKIRITNTFVVPDTTVDFTINKEWIDNNNENGERPDALNIVMYENDAKANTFELKASENWTKQIIGLPEYDENGDLYDYKFVEDFDNRFYKKVGILKENNVITFRNKYQIPSEKTNLVVEKVWDDNDNSAGKRPNTITVELYSNNVATGIKYELNESENWTYTFADLARYDAGGNEIEYSVIEDDIDNQFYSQISNEKEDDKVTITNRFEVIQEYIDVKVKKIWDDNNNEALKRSDSIIISLYADGTKKSDCTLTETENWEHIFEDVNKYNSNGDEIVYTVVETLDNENYKMTNEETTTEGDNKVITITNSFEVKEEQKSITVNKIWNDNNNVAGKRPEYITVNLKNGANIIRTGVLKTSNNWSISFDNLSRYDNFNNEIEYTAEEIVNSDFYVQTDYIDENTNNTIQIVNKFVVPNDTVNVKAQKIWEDRENIDNSRPEKITIILKDNTDTEIDRHEIRGSRTTNEDWNYTFTELPKYNSNGDIVIYSVDEEINSDFYNKQVNGYTIINTYKLNNSVVLNPNIEKTGAISKNEENEDVDYKITYTATIDDFYGEAIVNIIDYLPYEIDEAKSNINGGIYDANNKTITWVEKLEDIDTYKNGKKIVLIEKNISVIYNDIKPTDDIIKNYVTADIKLENTDIEEKVDDEWKTIINRHEEVKSRKIIEDKKEENNKKTTSEKAPSEEVPSEETTSEETPSEEVPSEEIQNEEMPSKKTANVNTEDNIKYSIISFVIALFSFIILKIKDK